MVRFRSTVVAAGLALAATPAFAQTDLITNSNFTLSGGKTITTGFQPDYNGTLDGWSNSNANGGGAGTNDNVGYAFLFLGTGGNQSVTGSSGALSLWNSADGGATTWNGTGPLVGGVNLNYIAADGVYQTGALSTQVSGLTVGVMYKLQFDYAGAQQYSFTGTTTEGWKVALGDTLAASLTNVAGSGAFQTATLSNANHSFTGWGQASFFFVADATTEYLSFLAQGTPNGEPPFTLLSDPVIFIPEPASLTLLLAALGGVAYMRRRRA